MKKGERRGKSCLFILLVALVLILMGIFYNLLKMDNNNNPEILLQPSSSGPATDVMITWSSSSGADDYNVRRYSGSSGVSTLVCSSTSSNYCGHSLNMLTSFFGSNVAYTVDACNAVGCSSESLQITLDLNYLIPQSTSGVNAVILGNSIDLSWTDVANENHYKIEKDVGNGFVFLTYVGSDVTSYTDNANFVVGVNYEYRVTSENILGQGNLGITSSIVFANIPNAPSGLTVALT